MTALELVDRLRHAGCFVFIHNGSVVLIAKKPEIFEDLRARGARGTQYVRNPWGARRLGEEPIVEFDITLPPGIAGVTGPGGEPVTLDDLMAAVRS